jgi:hypothetical protein
LYAPDDTPEPLEPMRPSTITPPSTIPALASGHSASVAAVAMQPGTLIRSAVVSDSR